MKEFDNKFLTKDIQLIAGVDEAGRGPLAGPVVSASVIFIPDFFIEGVNDSKVLSEKKREELYPQIIDNAVSYSVSVISHGMIDKLNILQASLLSMSTAVERLKINPQLILIDGNKVFPSQIQAIPIVDGDAKSFCIAAASIIAKVTRDRIMKRLSAYYPEYLWHKNKGYATREHINAIHSYGPCSLHRKTFLRKILSDEFEPAFKYEMEQPEV